ncbi:MAG: nitrogenase component 1 [Clostridiales bacterium]|nr:nitrogenase component 1 [Clostridiales bacterium]
MLEMIHGTKKMPDGDRLLTSEREMIHMKDAAWPVPFRPGLEYNSPAHGTWNIVHTGMLIPGSHQIYVCADNCNRGVVLTAAEMNAVDRFSTIALCEEDVTNGGMEELVIDGVADILHKLKRKPTVVLLFTVCLHHFMGCDLDFIYRSLRERFPGQRFVDCYMDPIMQKDGWTPDQKLRKGMYDCLEKRDKNRKQINIIGNDLELQPDCEMLLMVKAAGYRVKDITTCKDFEEYLSMAESFLNISTYPPAKMGAEHLSRRLEMDHLYLPQTFHYEEIDAQMERLAEYLKIPMEWEEELWNREKTRQVSKEQTGQEQTIWEQTGQELQSGNRWIYRNMTAHKKCEEALEETKKRLGDTPIVLDASAVPRYLGLARFLLEHGFSVIRIYGDSFSPEEEKDYQWLKTHAPELEICATIHANMRVFPRTQRDVLAIGQKAAYFHQTSHFVNMVEGGGLYGYAGICRLAEMMREAFCETKDTKDLIMRKGLGCESCI